MLAGLEKIPFKKKLSSIYFHRLRVLQVLPGVVKTERISLVWVSGIRRENVKNPFFGNRMQIRNAVRAGLKGLFQQVREK